MKRYALIVAGGSGTRMGSDVPKQFLLLKGKPVLMHTLNAFQKHTDEIILVLPKAQLAYWEQLCSAHHFQLKHQLVEGGQTRFHSVRNGLEAVGEGLVAIHDGVRPLVSADVIERTFETAAEKGNAIAAVKLKDSIREITLTGGSRNANRANFYLVQTPQTFRTGLIKKAYSEATHYNFTDDAAVLEEHRGKINMVEGDYRNLKITTPEDLLIAAALLG